MTDKEKLAKVRAEIERRRDRHSKAKRIESALEDNAILSFIDSIQEEPVSEKECMYSTDNYTDEDRKALCDGCEEECRFNKKEEPVNNGIDLGCGVIWKDEEPASEDLEEAIGEYCSNPDNFISYVDTGFAYRSEQKDDIPLIIKAIKFGVQWKEQQLMAKAIDATVHIDAGGYPYIPQMELYDYYKDAPLTNEGDKYKVILIKED